MDERQKFIVIPIITIFLSEKRFMHILGNDTRKPAWVELDTHP